MAKFKTRARTVDMLGRQQIANASTAINELMKNAYDAYAENLCIDYVCADDLIAIRDDGVGMTPDEFEDHWLVLGTDSKFFGENKSRKTYKPAGVRDRVIMGEKGIGRLAIGMLGRQVLIFTRANRDGNKCDLLMCFIHWGLFEIPGLNLEEIEFPTQLVKNGKLPDSDEIGEFVQSLSDLVMKLPIDKNEHALKSILNDIETVKFDLQKFLKKHLGPNLSDWNSGTQFYIFSPSQEIQQEIELETRSETKDFSKSLLGFSNTVFCGEKKPVLATEFRYWNKEGEEQSLISEREFFTSKEISSADHRIEGYVDEFGQFIGKIRVYDREITDHVISYPIGNGKKTKCGPFEIDFGYLAGMQRDTTLPPEDWNRMNSKLNQIGGLYVYRDNIRILPYGNSDFDWLKIEERRSKSAGYYFFSYRRIFGAVILTRENNSLLHEKAGREGFQQDIAYRQFKEILINLFLQLAADFFREEGQNTHLFNEQRAELNRLDKAKKRRENETREKRKRFELSLEKCFNQISTKAWESEFERLKNDYFPQMKDAASRNESNAVHSMEIEVLNKLKKIKKNYQISKPSGIGLSKLVRRDWILYEKEFEKLNREVFTPFESEISEFSEELKSHSKNICDIKKDLSSQIDKIVDKNKNNVVNELDKFKSSVNEFFDFSQSIANKSITVIDSEISAIKAEFEKNLSNNMSSDEFKNQIVQSERRLQEIVKNILDNLRYTQLVIDKVTSGLNGEVEVMESDVLEAMDQELLELREQADMDADMVQLGAAIAVINHEFVVAIKSVKHSLSRLEKLSDKNTELKKLSEEIQRNFEHLNGQLSLFTPLHKRFYRKRVSISGGEINHYVKTLFYNRLRRHNIEFDVTDNFLNTVIQSYPSTIYPVFVNIIDNAIFWLMSMQKSKIITLDAENSSFIIRNNGPAILSRDYESVFEQGFTRKPGGRGLGLFISKKALEKDDLEISIEPNSEEFGVTFKICWEKQNEPEV